MRIEVEMHMKPKTRREHVVAHVSRSANAHANVNVNAGAHVYALVGPGAWGDSTGSARAAGTALPVLIGVQMVSQSHTSAEHDSFGALLLIRFFLGPSSRAPTVERIDSARCALHARRGALRGVARRRSFAMRCADRVGKRCKERPALPALCGAV